MSGLQRTADRRKTCDEGVCGGAGTIRRMTGRAEKTRRWPVLLITKESFSRAPSPLGWGLRVCWSELVRDSPRVCGDLRSVIQGFRYKTVLSAAWLMQRQLTHWRQAYVPKVPRVPTCVLKNVSVSTARRWPPPVHGISASRRSPTRRRSAPQHPSNGPARRRCLQPQAPSNYVYGSYRWNMLGDSGRATKASRSPRYAGLFCCRCALLCALPSSRRHATPAASA